jgi:hypothetical protein
VCEVLPRPGEGARLTCRSPIRCGRWA